MGITIIYRGQLKSPDLIGTICMELKRIATLMEWDYSILILKGQANFPGHQDYVEIHLDYVEIHRAQV